MSADVRVAPATLTRTDADRRITTTDGVARIDDESVNVGPVRVAFLDIDALAVADHQITLDVWPGNTLVLSGLGRRFDAFSAELVRTRSRARVAGLLAHGITPPQVYQGSVLQGPTVGAAQLEIYETHLTFIPTSGDPWQIPLGALTELREQADPPAVALQAGGERTVVGMLGRNLEAFQQAVAERRDAVAGALHAITGHDGFHDGWGLTDGQLGSFQHLLARATSPERSDGARTLLARATAPARLGFVQLLDLDGAGLAAPEALPQPWASFLLVPVGRRTVLEILAGPQAATYVFEADPEVVNRDLQQLHFRRAPLALTEEQAELAPSNPHRLALRRLAPLMRLRTATVARLLHNDQWTEALEMALA